MKKMFYKIDILVIEDPQMAPNPEALELCVMLPHVTALC